MAFRGNSLKLAFFASFSIHLKSQNVLGTLNLIPFLGNKMKLEIGPLFPKERDLKFREKEKSVGKVFNPLVLGLSTFFNSFSYFFRRVTGHATFWCVSMEEEKRKNFKKLHFLCFFAQVS